VVWGPGITYGLPTIHNLSGQTTSKCLFLLEICWVKRNLQLLATELRLPLGKHFKNVWLGFMSETPRWSLSGEALWKASMRRSPCGTVRHKNISAHAEQACCRNEVSTGFHLGHKTFTLRHTVFKSAG
jgi:hypothetical protein